MLLYQARQLEYLHVEGVNMPWDPTMYLTYTTYRLRPALDLINRIPLEQPNLIVDLGCGVGDITRQLRIRWPEARIIGVDSSKEKLDKASQGDPEIEWRLGDIEDWSPGEPVDLLFSNSSLNSLEKHDKLFPTLISWIKPGGVFAVQMPRNFAEPAFSAIYKTAREGPWSKKLENFIRPEPCKSPHFYWELLHSYFRMTEIWETIYLQVMEGDNPVADFVLDSSLKKFIEVLDYSERLAFEEAYKQKIKGAYPPGEDGKTLFSNRRVFILGIKNEIYEP